MKCDTFEPVNIVVLSMLHSGLHDPEHSQAERALPEELRPGGVQAGPQRPLHSDLPTAHQSGRGYPAAHDR